jgi:hypothetical protein
VVHPETGQWFINLARVSRRPTLGRTVLLSLLAVAGVAVVMFSWMVPEPPPAPAPALPIANLACTAKSSAPPPSYGTRGTRTVAEECVR